MAQVKLYQGDFEQAILLAEKAVELELRLDRAHFALVQIAMIKGDRGLAKEKAREAIEINPDWRVNLEKILGETIMHTRY